MSKVRNASSEAMQIWEPRFSDWLFRCALPLWCDKGLDTHAGGFQEALGMDGVALDCFRRARVQGRQSFVFALAGKLGWDGPWGAAAQHGLEYLRRCYRRSDGLYCTQVFADGSVADPTVMTYDQAFVLLAAAQLYAVHRDREDLKLFARSLMQRICLSRRCPEGGYWEAGSGKYLSNPQMHLLEATLAWASLDLDSVWTEVAEEIVGLALNRFIDPKLGVLYETFEAQWALPEDTKKLGVEPGHQFEWAWLLERWTGLTGRYDAHSAAETLFNAGSRGVDPVRNVAIDEIDNEFRPRRDTARLWPQTERLKAALILYGGAEKSSLSRYEREAVSAAESLWCYLDVPLKGLWRDKMLSDGSFVDEPAPASSFYRIAMSIDVLISAGNAGTSQYAP